MLFFHRVCWANTKCRRNMFVKWKSGLEDPFDIEAMAKRASLRILCNEAPDTEKHFPEENSDMKPIILSKDEVDTHLHINSSLAQNTSLECVLNQQESTNDHTKTKDPSEPRIGKDLSPEGTQIEKSKICTQDQDPEERRIKLLESICSEMTIFDYIIGTGMYFGLWALGF